MISSDDRKQPPPASHMFAPLHGRWEHKVCLRQNWFEGLCCAFQRWPAVRPCQLITGWSLRRHFQLRRFHELDRRCPEPSFSIHVDPLLLSLFPATVQPCLTSQGKIADGQLVGLYTVLLLRGFQTAFEQPQLALCTALGAAACRVGF